MNILITGGAGFIGSHLVKRFLENGYSISIVDVNKVLAAQNVKSFQCDVVTWCDSNKKEISNFDIVVHCAGNAFVPDSVSDPEMDFSNNVLTTFKLLETIRKADKKPKLIFISSAAVYGNPQILPVTERAPLDPLSPYGVSKLAAERYIAVYSQVYNIPSAIVRPFSVYGPGLGKQVVYDLCKKIMASPQEIELFGNGLQTRDFIFIDDLVNAIECVMLNSSAKGEVFNIASGTQTSINQIVEIVCEHLGVKPKVNYTGSVRSGEPQNWWADISKIKSIGFLPGYSMNAGLKLTADWAKKH